MSDFVEILYPQSMTAKLMCNGEIVDEYKIEQCDKCSQLKKFDKFGYQKAMTAQITSFGFAVIADDHTHGRNPMPHCCH